MGLYIGSQEVRSVPTGLSPAHKEISPWYPDHKVLFIDYDGTVLKTAYCYDGGRVIPPANPSHAGLLFQGWNHPIASFVNVTSDLVIGATYITDDGATKLHIRLNAVTGLSPSVYLTKMDTSELIIDWGDGSSSIAWINIAGYPTSHTYASEGDYTISLSMANVNGRYSLGGDRSDKSVLSYYDDDYRDSLLSVNLGNNINTLTSYAFSFCLNLTSVTIPNNVISMGNNTFYNCPSLTSITVPSGFLDISDEAFYYCESATYISIPKDVLSIGMRAFAYCVHLKSIIIPKGVTTLATNLFWSCLSLPSVTIPDGVTTIASLAFQHCKAMTSITIPSSVNSILRSAFSGTLRVQSYVFHSITPPILPYNDGIFAGITPFKKIYVPDDSLSLYKLDASWSNYANYMYPLSDYKSN